MQTMLFFLTFGSWWNCVCGTDFRCSTTIHVQTQNLNLQKEEDQKDKLISSKGASKSQAAHCCGSLRKYKSHLDLPNKQASIK